MCCGETPHNNRHRRNTPAVEIGRGVFVRRRSKMVKCSFATFCKKNEAVREWKYTVRKWKYTVRKWKYTVRDKMKR